MRFFRQPSVRLSTLGRQVRLVLLVFCILSVRQVSVCRADPPSQEIVTPSEKTLRQPDAVPPQGSEQDAETPDTLVTGVVLDLKEKPALPEARPGEDDTSVLSLNERVQVATVRVTSGELKGRTVTVENVQGDNPIYNIPLEKGARVLLYVEKNPDGHHQVYISNRDRLPVLMLLFGALLLSVLIIGGKRTFRYLVLMTFALLMLTRSVVPPILAGEPGSLMAMIMSLLVALLGGMLLLPESRQTPGIMLLVILSTLVNVTVLLLIIFVASVLAPLHGFFSESLATLWYQYPKLDFQQMLFATAVVSHLGLLFLLSLVMVQACLSVVESAAETEASPVFQAGMRQGRNILGPALLAISLLYAGLYFPNLLQGAESTLLDTLNLEVYATYAAILLSGALAMVLSIPVTSGLCAWLLGKQSPKEDPA